jgi:hypothetical protein
LRPHPSFTLLEVMAGETANVPNLSQTSRDRTTTKPSRSGWSCARS